MPPRFLLAADGAWINVEHLTLITAEPIRSDVDGQLVSWGVFLYDRDRLVRRQWSRGWDEYQARRVAAELVAQIERMAP